MNRRTPRTAPYLAGRLNRSRKGLAQSWQQAVEFISNFPIGKLEREKIMVDSPLGGIQSNRWVNKRSAP